MTLLPTYLAMQVLQLNDRLVKKGADLNIYEYVAQVIGMFYIDVVDDRAVNEMIKVATKTDVSIRHSKLIEAGVLSKRTFGMTRRLDKLIAKHRLTVGSDYLIRTEYNNERAYFFGLNAFMMIISKHRYTNTYVEIFMVVHNCVQLFYDDFLHKAVVVKRDAEIDRLQELLKKYGGFNERRDSIALATLPLTNLTSTL